MSRNRKIVWMALGIAVAAFTACEKSARAPEVSATAANVAVKDADVTRIAKEPGVRELSAEKQRLRDEADLEMSRMKALQREIAGYEQAIAELKSNLASAAAAKKEMQADTDKLKVRWPKELQGFGESKPAPIIETHREDLAEIGKLLEENSALKKRLAEEGK